MDEPHRLIQFDVYVESNSVWEYGSLPNALKSVLNVFFVLIHFMQVTGQEDTDPHGWLRHSQKSFTHKFTQMTSPFTKTVLHNSPVSPSRRGHRH